MGKGFEQLSKDVQQTILANVSQDTGIYALYRDRYKAETTVDNRDFGMLFALGMLASSEQKVGSAKSEENFDDIRTGLEFVEGNNPEAFARARDYIKDQTWLDTMRRAADGDAEAEAELHNTSPIDTAGIRARIAADYEISQ